MTPALLVCRKRCLRSALLRNTEILQHFPFCLYGATYKLSAPALQLRRAPLLSDCAPRSTGQPGRCQGTWMWLLPSRYHGPDQNALKPWGMLCFGVWKSRMGNGWDAVRRQRKGEDNHGVPQAVGTPSSGAEQWQQEGSDPVVRSLALHFASSPCSRRQKDEKKLLLNSTPKRNKVQGPTFWPAGWSQKVP